MKPKPKQSPYPRALLVFLLLAMVAATWGVGLAVEWPIEAKALYLTLTMLTVAEALAIYHAGNITDGTVGRKNMPIHLSGTVLLALYLVAIVILTAMAFRGIPFPTLLILHAISFLALMVGWVVMAFAVRHAKVQDKRHKKRMASFADIKNRFGAFCHNLEQIPGLDEEVKGKARSIRDEVIRFARSDSDPGMEASDSGVAAKMANLESILARLSGTHENGGVSAEISQALEDFKRTVQRREME